MKCVLCFTGVLLLQMAGIQCQKWKAECGKELGISDELMNDFQNSNGKPEFHCFKACMFKKAGMLEPGKNINMAKTKEMAIKVVGDKAEDLMKINTECIEKVKDSADDCDFINTIITCVLEKMPGLPSPFIRE